MQNGQPLAPNNGGVEAFLNPNSMMTPGILGGMVTVAGNGLAHLALVDPLYIALVLSFLFGASAIIQSGNVLQKVVFYIMNSFIIFSVALGANNVGVALNPNPAQRGGTSQVMLGLVSSAYAGDQSSTLQVAQFFRPWLQTPSARFTKNSCRSIHDNNTNLDWYVGPDETLQRTEAEAWIHNLRECGDDWQMPTIAQLATLFDKRFTAGTGWYERGRYWPAHIDPIFSGIGGGSWAWATGSAGAQGAPAFNFNTGEETRIRPTDAYSVRAFAVKPAGG